MNSRHTYSAVIVGAGRIGAGFDSPTSSKILTHAHALCANKRIEFLGFVDTDAKQGNRAAEKWNARYFSSLREAFGQNRPDIVVIASPEQTHAQLLIEACDLSARTIVCEKPLIVDRKDLEQILRLPSHVPIIVNYGWRLLPVVKEIKEQLGSGNCGAVINASAIYGKGLLHNGVHMVDLASYFFGDLVQSRLLALRQDWEGDPTISAFMEFENCQQFHLIGADERAYSIMEIDILTERKRFKIWNEGRMYSEWEVAPDPLYDGYVTLGAVRTRKTGHTRAMSNLVANAIKVLDGLESPCCSLRDALKAEENCLGMADDAEKL